MRSKLKLNSAGAGAVAELGNIIDLFCGGHLKSSKLFDMRQTLCLLRRSCRIFGKQYVKNIAAI